MKLLRLATRLPEWLTLAIIATVPLLFGAVHPIVQGGYVALVLVVLGGWLVWSTGNPVVSDRSFGWYLPIVLFLCFLILQSVPLPLSWVEFFSPARAERVMMVNRLAHTDQSYVSLSDHGLVSLQRAILVASLFIFYMSVRGLLRQSDSFVSVLLVVIIGVGTFEAVYGLFQFLSPRIGILWLPIPSRAAYGTIIYKNQFASFLNMCWPLAVGGALYYLKKSLDPPRRKGGRHRIRTSLVTLAEMDKSVPLYSLGAGIMLMAVLFSLSRGGIIAMLWVMICLAVILPVRRNIKIVFAGFFLFFIGGYGLLLGLDTVITRFNSIDLSGSNRLGIYLASLPMLWDHWLAGIGLGSYTLLSPIYLEGFPDTLHFDRVHNEYLELMIELGIPAATLLFGWLATAVLSSGRSLVKKSRSSGTRSEPRIIVAAAAYCGLLGFLVHGLVDFGWRLPANLFYAVILAALVNYGLDGKPQRSGLPRESQ